MKAGKIEDAVRVTCEKCDSKFPWWFDPDAKVGEEEKIVCPKCGNLGGVDGSRLWLYMPGLEDFLSNIGVRVD